MKKPIEQLRKRTLENLDRVQRFFINTRLAYLMAREQVKDGHNQKIDDPRWATSLEIVSHLELYENRTLPTTALVYAIQTFEVFFFDLLRIYLHHTPTAISDEIKVETHWVLMANSREELIGWMIEQQIKELKDLEVDEAFKFLNDNTGLDYPSPIKIGQLKELFAARDVFLRSHPVADGNYIYRAGRYARWSEGDAIEVNQAYFSQALKLVRTIASRLGKKMAALGGEAETDMEPAPVGEKRDDGAASALPAGPTDTQFIEPDPDDEAVPIFPDEGDTIDEPLPNETVFDDVSPLPAGLSEGYIGGDNAEDAPSDSAGEEGDDEEEDVDISLPEEDEEEETAGMEDGAGDSTAAETGMEPRRATESERVMPTQAPPPPPPPPPKRNQAEKRFQIRTRKGTRNITLERLEAFLKEGKLHRSMRVISPDLGKTWVTVEEALALAHDSESAPAGHNG